MYLYLNFHVSRPSDSLVNIKIITSRSFLVNSTSSAFLSTSVATGVLGAPIIRTSGGANGDSTGDVATFGVFSASITGAVSIKSS